MVGNNFIFLGFLAIFVGLRLYNLLAQPMYLDEGIYIFWSKLVSESAGLAYVSLQDGKTPLYFWLIALFRGFVGNTLLTGRLISVGASVISLFSWLVIIKGSVRYKYSYLVYLAFFAVMPLGLMTERMAFSDSLLGAFISLSTVFLCLAYWSIDNKKIYKVILWSLLSGLSLGFGYMTKTTTRLFLTIQMGVIFFWTISYVKDRKLFKVVQLVLVAGILYFIYNQIVGFLRFGGQRFWSEIANKESLLIFSADDIILRLINEPLSYLAYVPLIGEYIFYYFGVTLPLIFAGFVEIVKKDFKNYWILFTVTSIVLAVFLSGKVMASRYFYILVPVTSAIITIGAIKLIETKSKLNLLVVSVIWFLLFLQSFVMITLPYDGIYASDDKNYYYTSDVNAYGLSEVINYLEGKEGNSIVGIYGTWGIPEGSRVIFGEHQIEAVGLPNILISNLVDKTGRCKYDRELIDKKCWKVDFVNKKDKYIYIVGKYGDMEVLNRISRVKKIFTFEKPNGGISSYLYKVL